MNRAAVHIPEKIFFKIGEVCEIVDVQAHVLRYWESEFPMLAPQKNRAGQRTYRRRDVEMALRIKELLYEDQYTIAGAKKKLASELRGTSKLKVVTPEMSARETAPPNSAVTPPSSAALPQPSAETLSPSPAMPSTQRNFVESTTSEPRMPLSDDRRVAIRALREKATEVLALLDEGEAKLGLRRK